MIDVHVARWLSFNAAPERASRAERLQAMGRSCTPTPEHGCLDPVVIDRIVHHRYGDFRVCYERRLNDNRELEGRVAIKFTVDVDGTVSNAVTPGRIFQTRRSRRVCSMGFDSCDFRRPMVGRYPIDFALMN